MLYEKPGLEILYFEVKDVVCASKGTPGGSSGGSDGGYEW